MNKGDLVKRKGFRTKYEIIADRNNKDTGFASAYGGNYILKDGFDFVIVNIEDNLEGIRPFEDVLSIEIEPYEKL